MVFRKFGRQSRSAAWLADFRSTYEFLLTKRTGHYLTCVAIAFSYYVVYYTGTFLLLGGFGIFYPLLRFALAVLFGVAPCFPLFRWSGTFRRDLLGCFGWGTAAR